MEAKVCSYNDCKYEGTKGCRAISRSVFFVVCDKYVPTHSDIIKKLRSHRNGLKGIKANDDNRHILNIIIKALEE